jgi:hypothetical protein
MLVYIEFKSRRPTTDLEYFHKIANRNYLGWADEHPEDVLVLNLARTWRIGPDPEYVIVYYTANGGLERLGAWEQVFKSGQADHLEAASRLAGRIDRAGCYIPLIEPRRGDRGPYYAELFEFAPGAAREAVSAHYRAREQRHPQLQLNLLVDRIGKLGPDPRGIAIWELPGYEALEPIATELDSQAPIKLVDAALYANCGEEVL